jgi:hypothetical protein
MLISKLRTGPVWGLGGLILGVVLSATVGGALGLSASTPPSPNKSQTEAVNENAALTISLPQRIILSVVKNDEIDVAIKDFSLKSQSRVREDLINGKYRLLWLTLWDWDTEEGEAANTVMISTDAYRQLVSLNNRRTRIAIREPQSGYIGMRGVFTADGNINISLLSGTQPIALPRMSPGQDIKLKIDTQLAGERSSSINIPPITEE